VRPDVTRPQLLILRSARIGRKQNHRRTRVPAFAPVGGGNRRGADQGREAAFSLAGLQTPEHLPINQVENTGLEPVTSWLQTRRSPS
jgi:hypothetical protein